jgi:hypothetical protein
MGEIAEAMLDGDLCEGCGVYMGDPGQGFPRRCPDCAKEQRADNRKATLAHHQQIKKVPCLTCGKKVKAVGLADHQRDAHGVTEVPRG